MLQTFYCFTESKGKVYIPRTVTELAFDKIRRTFISLMERSYSEVVETFEYNKGGKSFKQIN